MHNADATDRMIEEWNLVDLLSLHCGSPVSCDCLRAASQRYLIFICDAAVGHA